MRFAIRLPHVWTDDETKEELFRGWFYGIGRRGRRIGIVEVYPRIGLCFTLPGPWWSPRAWWWLVRDCFRYQPTGNRIVLDGEAAERVAEILARRGKAEPR